MKKFFLLLTSFIFSSVVFAGNVLLPYEFEMKCKSTDGTYINFFLGSVVYPTRASVLDLEIRNKVISANILDFAYYFPRNVEVAKTNDRFSLRDRTQFAQTVDVEFNRVESNTFQGLLRLITSSAGIRVTNVHEQMTCTSNDF
jgi:hypothetical protein